MTAIYDDALAPFGMTLAQFSLLRRVERHQPISISQLGLRADLDRTTMSRNVRVLQRRKWVQLAPGADQREEMVSLAPVGKEAIKRAVPSWAATQQHIEAALGEANLESLPAILLALASMSSKCQTAFNIDP